MPRRARSVAGGIIYHVLNRANARATLFDDEGEYDAFERVLAEALERTPVDLFSWCLMPNHWHLVLRPRRDRDLPEFMRWLTVTHTQRWHAHHHTSGSGHLDQGRYKSFPVQEDLHFLIVCRYVERNALRANLVGRAENWRFSSLWRRHRGLGLGLLSEWPVERPEDWIQFVNEPHTATELRSCGCLSARADRSAAASANNG
ncbi:MAG TPA: transposase [Tepidisphaeraceae bacterium]|jgi:putative transposase